VRALQSARIAVRSGDIPGILARVARGGTTVAVALAVVACSLALSAVARADGDPGSDVLLAQNLFTGYDSGIGVAQQEQLGKLLDATAKAGAPVRVAIIAHPDDLGAVSALWHKPQQYAAYLGTELSLTYPGRLLVVMPNGLGFYWAAKTAQVQRVANALSTIAPGSSSPSALIAATHAAVQRVEAATGTSSSVPSPGISRGAIASPTSPGNASDKNAPAPLEISGGGTNQTLLAFALLAIVATVVLMARPLIRRRPWHPKNALTSAPLALLAVVLVALSQNGSTPVAQSGTLQTNPNLDPGTVPHPVRASPGFTLTDEAGRKVSLADYRGKVVILSFIDAECQTICPLTSTAMLDAKQALGSAGKDVQLLAVNANWRSIQVDDVLNYTDLHGMSGRWHFLTGSLPQLSRVWSEYGLNEYALARKQMLDTKVIDHVDETFVIDPQGRLRDVYQTGTSYAAIPQLGQLLAHDASRLLRSHPSVATHYGYGQIRGVSQGESATVPRLGGGRVTLGPGRAHLYLFFATWDAQSTPIAAQLELLNRYHRAARGAGLPPLTAIDEASVEPSAAALPRFIGSLRHPLSYPVALDETGRIADGYDVQGEPWFVLTSASGGSPWYREVYTEGWPTLNELERDVRGALSNVPTKPISERAAQADLMGSPAPLATLHAQASRVLGGGQNALDARIRGLRGYPVVVNVWGSWCPPCQAEFKLFTRASAQYGKRVAFLGSDTNEPPNSSDGQQFLEHHYVSYPSYETTPQSMQSLLVGGLAVTPTTIFISSAGTVTHVTDGQYRSQGALDRDIEQYALGGR
jgi:cytochrome oxidase Cu insertion factor (SCO1/SenC/PrrC family)/thiol-disulfide isomerase/thioredoxin